MIILVQFCLYLLDVVSISALITAIVLIPIWIYWYTVTHIFKTTYNRIVMQKVYDKYHGKLFEADILGCSIVGIIKIETYGAYLLFNNSIDIGIDFDETDEKGYNSQYYVSDLKEKTLLKAEVTNFKIIENEK